MAIKDQTISISDRDDSMFKMQTRVSMTAASAGARPRLRRKRGNAWQRPRQQSPKRNMNHTLVGYALSTAFI